MPGDAGELKAKALLDNTDFIGKIAEMAKATAENTANMAGAIGNIGTALSALTQLAGAFTLGKGVASFVNDAIDAAGAANKMQAQMEAVNGTSEETKQIFEDMKNLGIHSMFDFADVLGPDIINLMRMGVEGKQAAETMHAIVDQATAMKLGAEWVNGVSEALANMSAKGIVTAKDIKNLQTTGVDAWSAIATAVGGADAAQTQLKNGTLDAKTAIGAITKQMQTDWEDVAAAASGSWGQAMHTMKGDADEAKEAFGQGLLALMKQFKPVINEVSQAIEDLTAWWTNLNTPVQEAVIIIGGAVTVVGSLAIIIPAVTAAVGALAGAMGVATATFIPAIAGITAVAIALGLIGEWVYNNWPAVKAVLMVMWDDVVTTWKEIWNGLTLAWNAIWDVFTFIPRQVIGIISAIWDALWEHIKGVAEPVIEWFTKAFGGAVSFIGGVISKITGVTEAIGGQGSTLSKVTQAWNEAQNEMADAAAKEAGHTQAVTDHKNAMIAAANARRDQTTADRLHADQAAAAAQAKKQQDADAKKAAEEAKQYNESLEKTYDTLRGIAPDVAEEFSQMYGGIGSKAVDAQAIVGKAWDTMDDGTKTLIQDTIDLGEAYKTLGLTSTATLETKVQDAAAAYDTLKQSGEASATDLNAAMDSVVAKQQAYVTYLSTDLKKAYDDGTLSADDYWQGVIDNAQASYEAVKKAYDDGLASATEVTAAEKVLSEDKKKKVVQDAQDFQDAVHSLGLHSQQDFDDAATKAGDFAKAIGQKLGTDSPQYIQAAIAQVVALREAANNMGDLQAVKDYNKQIDDLKEKLTQARTPQENFNTAIGALKVPDFKSMKEDLLAYATNLNTAKANSDGTKESTDQLAIAQQGLQDKINAYITSVTGPLKKAYDDGAITAQQYHEGVHAKLVELNTDMTTLAGSATDVGTKTSAAATVAVGALKQIGLDGIGALQKDYDDLGLKTTTFFQQESTKAHLAYEGIANDRNATWVQKDQAWLLDAQKGVAAIVNEGHNVPTGLANDIAAMQQKLTDHFEWTTTQWGTTYTSVKSTVGGVFDSLVEKIVTGKGSFKDILSQAWKDMALDLANGFLTPIKQGIEKLVSTTFADLLTGKGGISDIKQAFSDIGSTVKQLFGVGGDSGSGNVPIPGGGEGLGGIKVPPLPGMGGGSSSAPSSDMGGILGAGLTSWMSAIGSIGSMITGAIGDIQNIHMSADLTKIEKSTRYTEIYTGEQGDSILNTIHELRDMFSGGGPMQALQAIQFNLSDNLGDMKTNGETSMGYLSDIKGILQGIDQNLTTGFAAINVTVQAGAASVSEAARAMGDAIATNLAKQLAPIAHA